MSVSKELTQQQPTSKDEIRGVFESEDTVSDWDQAYYHPIAEKYYDEAVPDMLRAMGVQPGDQVVDAGCGPGVHSIRAAQYGAEVFALDLSEKMLSHARERAAAAGVEAAIKFQQADLTNLTLDDNRYRYVFNWGVIIHIPDTEAALDNLTRIVAPGGKLALQILNQSSFDYGAEKIIRKLFNKPQKGRVEKPLGTGVWYDYNDEKLWVLRFNMDALTDAMRKKGFRKISQRAAEYSEFQWRIKGPLRSLLLYLNRIAYKVRFPAALSCTQIVIFEKESA